MAEIWEVLKNRRDAEHQLIARAWSDEVFAEKLRTNPKAAIAEELGLQLPADYKVEIHEEKLGLGTWHLVIPERPLSHSDALTEVDLAGVAGGVWAPTPIPPASTVRPLTFLLSSSGVVDGQASSGAG